MERLIMDIVPSEEKWIYQSPPKTQKPPKSQMTPQRLLFHPFLKPSFMVFSRRLEVSCKVDNI
jgi:hypothetical protein